MRCHEGKANPMALSLSLAQLIFSACSASLSLSLVLCHRMVEVISINWVDGYWDEVPAQQDKHIPTSCVFTLNQVSTIPFRRSNHLWCVHDEKHTKNIKSSINAIQGLLGVALCN